MGVTSTASQRQVRTNLELGADIVLSNLTRGSKIFTTEAAEEHREINKRVVQELNKSCHKFGREHIHPFFSAFPVVNVLNDRFIADMKKKILLSWSSGKDCAWALHVWRLQGKYEVAGLLTTFNSAFDRVAMHSTRRALV